jgi:hypothetical protein
VITELALAHNAQGTPFIVATNVNPPDPGTGEPTGESWIELWQANGRVAWTIPQRIDGNVTALTVGDLNGDDASEIIVGSDGGRLLALRSRRRPFLGFGSLATHPAPRSRRSQ